MVASLGVFFVVSLMVMRRCGSISGSSFCGVGTRQLVNRRFVFSSVYGLHCARLEFFIPVIIDIFWAKAFFHLIVTATAAAVTVAGFRGGLSKDSFFPAVELL
jgi:hypothetical protein